MGPVPSSASVAHGPNTPWTVRVDDWRPQEPTPYQYLEFWHCCGRPWTLLDHELAGRAALIDGLLRPTGLYAGTAESVPPDVRERVLGGRADVYFHTHPVRRDGSDCWPSLPDLCEAFRTLSMYPEVTADVVVTRCGLVVVRRAEPEVWADADARGMHGQYAIVRTVRALTRNGTVPVDASTLRDALRPLGLDVVRHAPLDVESGSPASATVGEVDESWLRGFELMLQRHR